MSLKILQKSQENTFSLGSFLIRLQLEIYNFIKKETLAEVLSCEFYEVFKNSFFNRTLTVAASDKVIEAFHKRFLILHTMSYLSNKSLMESFHFCGFEF